MDYLYDDAPSIAFRIFEIPNLDGILKTPEFLKWSAMALAFVAAFGSLVRRLRVLELNVKRIKPLASQEKEEEEEDDDDESWSSDSSETEDGVVSSFSSLQEWDKASLLRDNGHPVRGCEEEDDFRVAGVSGMLRLRRSNSNVETSSSQRLCAAVDGGGVVKLWEGLGVDLRGGESVWRWRGRGKDEDYRRLVMGVWDTRMRPEVAAIALEWKSSLEKDLLGSDSLFADVDIWWWVDPTKAVVARLVDCSLGHGGVAFPG